ncbi:Hpt domain-containing protein [Tranquillimonas alkanivorans]|uniref:HPt domain-containing protein n=1 Tax=Tranquillimonas alkanivorans TaxID=441119 RepID=A0A1I5RZC0_9RHOB|nr:Hpt domain-containing protein [Tranquillimonas alkanivorans]SFP63842.1 hypothetical protein SAMN04488047_109166 [Tranquillimonas alkanivorans]
MTDTVRTDLERTMAGLRDHFLGGLEAAHADMQEKIVRLAGNTPRDGDLAALRDQVHRIAGIAPALELWTLAKAAAAADRRFIDAEEAEGDARDIAEEAVSLADTLCCEIGDILATLRNPSPPLATSCAS